MTSKELQQRAKEVKKIENTIKALEIVRKHMMNLPKLDYESYKVITNKYNDDLWYEIDDRIKLLQARITDINSKAV